MVEPKSARAYAHALTAVLQGSFRGLADTLVETPLLAIVLGTLTASGVTTAAVVAGVDGLWIWPFVALGWVMAGIVGWGWQR